MSLAFLASALACSYTLQLVGAWSEESPKSFDLLAFMLLALLCIVLAITYSPFTEAAPYHYPVFFT